MTTPKPPVPVVAQREILVKAFTIPNGFGEGKHVNIAGSIEHEKKPIGGGFFDYVRGQLHLMSIVVDKNPDGNGTRCIEIRNIDMMGSIPAMAANQISRIAPGRSFTFMNTIVNQKVAGQELKATF